jgi:hypothetical protein
MYQQQEEHARMQGMQQHYTLPPTIALPSIAIAPPATVSRAALGSHRQHCPALPFGTAAVKNDPGQLSSLSNNRILSFDGHPPSTMDFS